ncbi:DUF4396 domain-containing protein [Yinghuangia aomiensis]
MSGNTTQRHDEHRNHGGHEGHDRHEGHEAHTAHEGHEGHQGREGHEGHSTHEAHGGHDAHAGHHAHAHGPVSWRMAALATLHCLTGCAIGEILGLAIGTAFGWGNGATIVIAVVLAFVFGYGLTMFGLRKAGLSFTTLVKTALAADTVSIVVMEIIDNGFMMFYPGAMDAGLGDLLFWGALVAALALAFVVTTPVNKWLIAQGKGHAAVHGMH